MAPQRVQRKRVKGWRAPEGAVYVGRPSRWGNPFVASRLVTRAEAVRSFRDALEGRRPAPDGMCGRAEIAALRGRPLMCWCPHDVPCHADVLLELANA